MGRDLVELTFSFQSSIFISSFLKKREQLMCITLSSNVFIERVTILFLFYVPAFWPRATRDLSSLTRGGTCTRCTGSRGIVWFNLKKKNLFSKISYFPNITYSPICSLN